MSNDMICGKNLAHWFYKVYIDIYGGVPPTPDDIRTESQMVHLFLDSLFVHNTGIQYKTKFNHILAASVLQFYDAFPGIIGNGPYGKYNDRSHNPFHHNIVSVVFELNISGETFDKCKKGVIDGFNNKNWLGVNIEKLAVDLQKCMLVAIVWSVQWTSKEMRLGKSATLRRLLQKK